MPLLNYDSFVFYYVQKLYQLAKTNFKSLLGVVMINLAAKNYHDTISGLIYLSLKKGTNNKFVKFDSLKKKEIMLRNWSVYSI